MEKRLAKLKEILMRWDFGLGKLRDSQKEKQMVKLMD